MAAMSAPQIRQGILKRLKKEPGKEVSIDRLVDAIGFEGTRGPVYSVLSNLYKAGTVHRSKTTVGAYLIPTDTISGEAFSPKTSPEPEPTVVSAEGPTMEEKITELLSKHPGKRFSVQEVVVGVGNLHRPSVNTMLSQLLSKGKICREPSPPKGIYYWPEAEVTTEELLGEDAQAEQTTEKEEEDVEAALQLEEVKEAEEAEEVEVATEVTEEATEVAEELQEAIESVEEAKTEPKIANIFHSLQVATAALADSSRLAKMQQDELDSAQWHEMEQEEEIRNLRLQLQAKDTEIAELQSQLDNCSSIEFEKAKVFIMERIDQMKIEDPQGETEATEAEIPFNQS